MTFTTISATKNLHLINHNMSDQHFWHSNMSDQHFWRSGRSNNTEMPYAAHPAPGAPLWFSQRVTLQRWCADHIGAQDERWSIHGNSFQFVSEADMMQFALVWQGTEIERAEVKIGDPELPLPPLHKKLI
jgi:hypothetical protein